MHKINIIKYLLFDIYHNIDCVEQVLIQTP